MSESRGGPWFRGDDAVDRREVERLGALASTEPARFGSEARRLALEAYDARNGYGVYAWTKAWISSGGGAWTVDAWLLYVVSALLDGKPRQAVHSVDMALSNWIEPSQDRAVLRWVRAVVIHRWLNDPKTAQPDYDAARDGAPEWLRARIDADEAACAADAATSRKRRPSVASAPDLAQIDRSFVAGPTVRVAPGSVPKVWPQLLEMLERRS